MLATLCATLALAVAATPGSHRDHAPSRVAQRTGSGKSAPRAESALDHARARLAEVKRDPAKRRYRHRWERAIAGLEKAARGRDTGPALLDAARARYALYRYSQVDSDRDAALALAGRAQRAGAGDASAFARAVRKEMGAPPSPPAAPARRRPPAQASRSRAKAASRAARPQPPARAPPPRKNPAAPPAPAPAPAREPGTASAMARASSTGEEGNDDDPSIDPILEQALTDAPATTAEEGDAGAARVAEVKSWTNHDYTRVAVYLSRKIAFTRVEIPGDAEHPRRLALDLKPALLGPGPADGPGFAHDVGDGVVQRVRAAQHDPDTVRVVLDLAGNDDFTLFALEDPPRLIVDVGVSDRRRPPQASAPPPAPVEPQARPRAPLEDDELTARRPIRRIIVDAGHGGHDTGAIGPTKVREKDVTLQMARRLARRLRARGFEVVLTRTDDRFVALEERTAIANARHGDLFVSLHANAHPRRDRGGVETYVLNVADNRYAARLAARENGALGDGELPELRRILSDLDAKSSVLASRRLAHAVQSELCAGIRTRVGEVRDLGVKSALFYVLLGARMPAVLVETSFISNRVEEKRLRSARFQDEVASAVARAVERFASRQARIASAR